MNSLQLQAKAIQIARQRGLLLDYQWPARYKSAKSGVEYKPQNEAVREFIENDKPRYSLLKGGEGGGKSAAGVIKDLNRLRRGMNGIMVSTDLQHFKKSIWPTFREWCPWNCVVPSQRRRQSASWEPTKSFVMVFKNEVGGYSELVCGGAEETNLKTWEGPNTSFVHFDEARGHKTPNALKMFDGRIRIRGFANEPPQFYLTTTPRKHWLFEYFAGAKNDEASLSLVPDEVRLKHQDFKRDAAVYTVLTAENPAIDEAFVRQRAQTLSEAEQRILLKALWEDDADVEKFVNIIWWDNCREETRPIRRDEPAVLALDAATGSENPGYTADCFAAVMVTRRPDRLADVMVRYCGIWEPQPGAYLDFEPIKDEIRRLCREFSIVEVTYDPTQLHDFANFMKQAQIANFQPFSQQKARLLADKQLQDLIMSRRVAHDGNPLLRQHIDNANVKKHGDDGIRLVKRSTSQKIDSAVALSMGCNRILYYNLG
jgi:hypothetical protein